jgi:hypothetical protein
MSTLDYSDMETSKISGDAFQKMTMKLPGGMSDLRQGMRDVASSLEGVKTELARLAK